MDLTHQEDIAHRQDRICLTGSAEQFFFKRAPANMSPCLMNMWRLSRHFVYRQRICFGSRDTIDRDRAAGGCSSTGDQSHGWICPTKRTLLIDRICLTGSTKPNLTGVRFLPCSTTWTYTILTGHHHLSQTGSRTIYPDESCFH